MSKEIEIIDNRNCVFDVKKIENRLKELGALEDVECEIVSSKVKPVNELKNIK